MENHNDASMFEKIELYVQHAASVMSDPQLYIKCVDSFNKFKDVVTELPSHLEEEIKTAYTSISDIALHEHKMEYLKRVVKYLGHSVDTWADELQHITDSPGFDFLELKPIFKEPPENLIHYVTRCKP